MTARTYGSKYQDTKELHVTDLAKLIRAEIKTAVKAGELPLLTYSVRSRHAGMSRAIDIRVKGFEIGSHPFPVVSPEFARNPTSRAGTAYRYTDEARVMLARLEVIREAYNYDASDPTTDYFDTRYYGASDFDGVEESAQRDRLAAEPPIPSPAAPEPIQAARQVTFPAYLFRVPSDTRYLN
jgi:hypothetical protein